MKYALAITLSCFDPRQARMYKHKHSGVLQGAGATLSTPRKSGEDLDWAKNGREMSEISPQADRPSLQKRCMAAC